MTQRSSHYTKKNIVFVVNPISHGLKGRNVKKILKQYLDDSLFDYEIVFTERPNHAFEIAQNAVLAKADIVVAIGGDGTVNEVGKALIHSQTALGIIPLGSGNGLAGHLHLPLDIVQAIRVLNQAQCVSIDTGKINDTVFLGVAGIGFDAHVAWEFAKGKRRGLASYIKIVLREFPKYESQSFSMVVDGKKISGENFIVSFANSSQYGNDFIIAPQARLQDGFLDLVMVKELPFYAVQQFVYHLKGGTLQVSKNVEFRRCREVVVKQPQIVAHIDGEPVLFHDEIKISVQPSSLKVMIPSL